MVLEEHGERVVIRKVLDHGSEAFRIEYYVAGQRRMKTRADESEAHTDAGRILAMLNERAPVFSQTEDATIYLAAKTVLGGLAPVLRPSSLNVLAKRRAGGREDAGRLFLNALPGPLRAAGKWAPRQTSGRQVDEIK